MTQLERFEALRRSRPRDHVLMFGGCAFAALFVAAWTFGGFDFAETFAVRRADNLERFFREVRPYPLQGRAWDWGIAWDWVAGIWGERGAKALLGTLAIAVLATVLASLGGAVLALCSARTLATAEPLLPDGHPPTRLRRWLWRALAAATRLSLILMRSMPEYVIAFLLLAMFGPSAWPLVLALAIHNAGILGRLYGETIENLPPTTLRALRGIGATRTKLAVLAIWPAALGRGLLYAFYRWETCVREATVLGMLGVVSLGYWIADARTFGRTDEFVLWIAFGALLVMLGDLVSAGVRRLVR